MIPFFWLTVASDQRKKKDGACRLHYIINKKELENTLHMYKMASQNLTILFFWIKSRFLEYDIASPKPALLEMISSCSFDCS